MDERKKMVLAMEYIARQVNDEEVFMHWLSLGVADGDIKYGETNPDWVDSYYTENDTFKELMTEFLRLMVSAWNSGGLYCDNVVSLNSDNIGR